MSDQQIIVVESDQQIDIQAAKDSILKLLSEGLTVQVIAARLNLDPSRVLAISDAQHAQQRQSADSGEKLHGYSGQLDELIDLAHWQCKAEPSPNNIYAYTALIETARGVMQDIDGRRDNARLTEDLMKRVLEPMMNEIIITMTQKLASAKIDLNSALPPEYHAHATAQVETLLRTLAAIMSDQLTGAKDAIGRVLSDVKTEQKPTPTRRMPKQLGR